MRKASAGWVVMIRRKRVWAAERSPLAASWLAWAKRAEVTEEAAEAEVTEVEVRVRTRTVPAPGAQQSSQWTARAPLIVRVPCG